MYDIFIVWLLALEFSTQVAKPNALGKVAAVVDAYEQGLLGRFPRARYLIGKDCFTFFLPVQYLPEWLGDWLIRKLFNLPGPSLRKEWYIPRALDTFICCEVARRLNVQRRPYRAQHLNIIGCLFICLVYLFCLCFLRARNLISWIYPYAIVSYNILAVSSWLIIFLVGLLLQN